jgi:hypothetical protein
VLEFRLFVLLESELQLGMMRAQLMLLGRLMLLEPLKLREQQ